MLSGGPRILLCQPRWLGDVLLCTPAIRALKHALPDARIDFLTEAAGAAALQGNADLQQVLVQPATVRGRLGMMAAVRRAGYDTVVDFRSTGSTAAVAFASNAPVRIGTHGRGLRNRAYTHLLPRERRPLYMAVQKMMMLQPLGIDTAHADRRLHIVTGAAEHARAGEILAAAGVAPDETVVAVSGASRVQEKRWGAPHWARIADALADAGARIVLTHGPGESEQVHDIARLMRAPAITDYGATTVRELAALFQRCALWIGNDGGPKHIAAAAGTPTVSVVRAGGGRVWNDEADPLQDFEEAAAHACTSCTDPCLGQVDEARVLAAALRRLR